MKNKFKGHERWPEIHADIVTSCLTPRQICEKYALRNENGSMPLVKVARYRQQILERYKDVFAKAHELEQQIIRDEVLGKMRHVYDCASEGHEMAKTQTRTVTPKGKDAIPFEVMTPDFAAMKMQQESMVSAASKLAEIVGIGPTAPVTPAPMYQDNRVLQVLAMPKSVPSRAPLRIVEAQKETA